MLDGTSGRMITLAGASTAVLRAGYDCSTGLCCGIGNLTCPLDINIYCLGIRDLNLSP
jgi:hypothetical protein